MWLHHLTLSTLHPCDMTQSQSHAAIVLFDTFSLLAVFLIAITMLPAIVSRSIRRSAGWYNLMATWLLFSIGYTLLIGKQEGPVKPPLGLCLAQILITYPAPTSLVHSFVRKFGYLLTMIQGLPVAYFHTILRCELPFLCCSTIELIGTLQFYLIISNLKSGNIGKATSLRTFWVGVQRTNLGD